MDPLLTLNEAEELGNGLFVQGDALIQELVKENNIILNTNVTKVNVRDNKVVSVESEDEFIKGDLFIFATGYWTTKILPSIELMPLKGHIVATRKVGLSSILLYKGFLATEGRELYLNGDAEQTDNLKIDFNIVNNIVNTLNEVLPNMEIRNVRISTGLRYMSPDGKPIVKKIYDNAIVITGYRFGFTLASVLVNEALNLLGLTN